MQDPPLIFVVDDDNVLCEQVVTYLTSHGFEARAFSGISAVEAALPEDTANDLYRILLTGETGEGGADAKALETALAGNFYALEVRDRTRVAADVWARAGEDSLRGLFLRELRTRWDAAGDASEREAVTQAVRFGLAALDHRDLG